MRLNGYKAPGHKNLIHDFVAGLDYLTDASWQLKEIAGLSALSVVASNYTVEYKEQKIPLNLFTLIVGETRLTRKSTVLHYTEDLLNNIDENLCTNLLVPIEVSPAEGEEGKKLLIVDPALLTRKIEQKNLYKTYLAGWSILLAVTPYYFYPNEFEPYILREIFILRVKPALFYPPFNPFSVEIRKSLYKQIAHTYRAIYRRSEPITLTLSPEAQHLYEEFTKCLYPRNPYQEGFKTKILKLAGLYAISRDSRRIEMTDLVNALRMAEECLRSYDAVIKEDPTYLLPKRVSIINIGRFSR